MSNTRTAGTKRAAKPRGKAVGKPGGETIPLVTPIPGGLARWRKPGDLTPRQTRELEIIGAELLPRIGEVAQAQRLLVNGRVVDESGVLTGTPVGLSRDELRMFMDFQDACAFAFLESWTLERAEPESADDLQDLPRALYDALVTHASKLVMAGDGVDFSVDSLPEDAAEADPDLPTSPSVA